MLPRPPDRARLEAAVRQFLDALGADLNHEHLRETPQRVAAAWIEQLTRGHRETPEEALGEVFASEGRAAVSVREVPVLATCPHHLLPLSGVASVAFLPDGKLAGFGRLPRLVSCFSRRLILQEELAQGVADTLHRVLGARAAVCVVRARHACVAVSAPEHQGVFFEASAQAGDPQAAQRLLQQLGAGAAKAG